MAESAPPQSTGNPVPRRRRLRRWLKRLTIIAIVGIVLVVGVVLYAEHRTSQPSFCGSCHIMEPYYASWKDDLHGDRLGVACVDCHYAPGERTTVKAKLRGLSQVFSYISGRYGSTRPRAHVSNLSCMTGECHGDGKFMDKQISLGTVTFVHAKHLKYDKVKRDDSKAALAQLTDTIRDKLGEERFGQLQAIANQAGPAAERISNMLALVESWSVEVTREEVENFSQLQHLQVRVAQLDDLQCTNCHSYSGREPQLNQGPSSEHHFSASSSACYTCHFNNEGFNTGTNRCLMCHSLPTQQITVHPELNAEEQARLDTSALAAAPVKMDHQTILERNVDCIACHADVASEDSQVTRRDCERCHDQPRFFKDWTQPFTLDVVAQYHKAHVAGQRAKCLDYHSEIHHELVREEAPETAQPGFLTTAMSNCTYCHPNQHAEQINLLRGAGGQGVAQSTPNMMFGARTNCYGCHTKVEMGDAMHEMAAQAASGCTTCHGDKHADTFEKWKLGIELSREDAEQAYTNAQTLFDEASDLPAESRQQVSDLLAAAKADLEMVRGGNGLHNVTYAMELLDSVTQRCQEAAELLEAARQTPP
jgi:nitrate/TMAO reductase-like tetraheme cytochrome c subunit